MATYYNHCQVGIVDASGNVNVIYPQTYASDVKVGTANSSIGITTSSTVQSLISKLGSAATKNVGDLVTNSASSSSTSQAYSCNQINSKLNELNSKMEWKVAWEGSVNQKTNTDGATKVIFTNNTYVKTYSDFIVYATPSPNDRCGNQIYLHNYNNNIMEGSQFYVAANQYFVGWCVKLNPATGNGYFGHQCNNWPSNGTTVTKILARK